MGLAMQLAPQEWPHWLENSRPARARSTTGHGARA
jgi:hypothetical protein